MVVGFRWVEGGDFLGKKMMAWREPQKIPGEIRKNEFTWLVLSDEQMSKGCPFSLLNDEQMSNWLGVEHQPVTVYGRG